MKAALKAAARSAGYEVVRINPTLTTGYRRMTMMTCNGIDTVLDVGANTGQYASMLRRDGYTGKILSFEPLSKAYETLARQSASDPKWRVFHSAVGAENAEAEINVAGNSVSSSLLPMLDTHVRNAPESQYQAIERIKVITLDSALKDVLPSNSRVLLKIDTQGYEHHVLEGAKSVLMQVRLIECELSLAPLYEGQYSFQDMVKFLDGIDFKPVHFDPGFSDEKTGYCLQVDGIFARSI